MPQAAKTTRRTRRSCRVVRLSPPNRAVASGRSQPAAAGVDDRLGLLADLLEHVVSVTAQLDRVGLPVDPVDPRRDRPALAMTDLEVAGREPDHLAILQVSHTSRMRGDRDGIAGQHVLIIAHAHHQRASQPGADDLVRIPRAERSDPVRSLEAAQHSGNGLERLLLALELEGDQVGDDLGIGLALEDESLALELASQRHMVFDHSVVHDGHGGAALACRRGEDGRCDPSPGRGWPTACG